MLPHAMAAGISSVPGNQQATTTSSVASSTPDVQPDELSVPGLIVKYAQKHHVNISTALNIACAESQFKATAKNKYSTASGVYQFLDGTWKWYAQIYWGSTQGRSKLDAEDNIELAMLVLRDKGTADWNASKITGLGGGWSKLPVEHGLCGSLPVA